ncbi:MAG: DNA-3-methyladenine glycosylase 2 family protein [Thermoleophilaceae bacterium]|nr:DNA-3-methyladenine glycosylase 2 family protein [Thermoleophilaceae bacterium]
MPRPGRPSAGSRTTPVPEDPSALRALRRADPVMAGLIERYGDPDGVLARRGRRPGDAYGALVRSIVGQQLSSKAARSIYERLVERFDGHTPTPRQLLETDPEEIRAVGLSRAKVAFLRDLAEHVEDGELDLEHLAELPDDEVLEQLTRVKGLGPWTVDMFLIFHLGRPDVLPVGDQGIRRAVQIAYGLELLPDAAELERIAQPWRPHRSLACLYLWRSLDSTPV